MGNNTPQALIKMKNGRNITAELFPEAAPNTFNSFVSAALKGFYKNHAIERIVPGHWIDLSYQAFGKKEAQYLIPPEFTLHPEIEPLPSDSGYLCMGGYGDLGLSGCEFFITLRACPEHQGIYPVFGRIIEGMDEIRRLEQVPTKPVTGYPGADIVINEPLEPEIIEDVILNLYGAVYPPPIRVEHKKLPECWIKNWRM